MSYTRTQTGKPKTTADGKGTTKTEITYNRSDGGKDVVTVNRDKEGRFRGQTEITTGGGAEGKG